MTKWQFYPKSKEIPRHLKDVVGVFERNEQKICSPQHKFSSDVVLGLIRSDLVDLGFDVESGKTRLQKICVPVLFGQNGRMEKSFDADCWNKTSKTVIEVEAGRGVTNYQFLKDFFQACVMYDVDYLIIAVRNDYRDNDNFATVLNFFNTMYASHRFKSPLEGILIVGY